MCKHGAICYIIIRKGQDPDPFSSLNSLMRDDHAQDRLAENAGRFLFHEVGRGLVDQLMILPEPF